MSAPAMARPAGIAPGDWKAALAVFRPVFEALDAVERRTHQIPTHNPAAARPVVGAHDARTRAESR